jgi:hypothetical protein
VCPNYPKPRCDVLSQSSRVVRRWGVERSAKHLSLAVIQRANRTRSDNNEHFRTRFRPDSEFAARLRNCCHFYSIGPLAGPCSAPENSVLGSRAYPATSATDWITARSHSRSRVLRFPSLSPVLCCQRSAQALTCVPEHRDFCYLDCGTVSVRGTVSLTSCACVLPLR